MGSSKPYPRKILKKQMDSIAMQASRSFWVYLPPGYNELLSYPVIYCQDGVEFLNYGRIATQASAQILDEGMEPAIIVGVDVDLKRRIAEYAPEGEHFASYCRFFAEELIPLVEKEFPVRVDPQEIILAGDSLGATVSLHLALLYPERFHQVIALSGAFLESTQVQLENEKDLSWLSVYMIIGLQENDVDTPWGRIDFIRMNQETKKLLEFKGARVRYKEADGKHIWGFWQKELPAAMNYFL